MALAVKEQLTGTCTAIDLLLEAPKTDISAAHLRCET